MRMLPGVLLFIQISMLLLVPGCASSQGLRSLFGKSSPSDPALERSCVADGWQKVTMNVAGQERRVLWKGPKKVWTRGAILVMHGGGGEAAHFCAGGRLVQPQIRFADMAIDQGFAVFALDATNDVVTDSEGRTCGKRFDFSVLDRPNVDLPYIGKMLTEVLPSQRPADSSKAVFITGLSTGGYMTIRAGAHFADRITAFAPISAGDPFGTDTNCDTSLSGRKAAKGILVDRETRKEITELNACLSSSYKNESRWDPLGAPRATFRQFHHADDGIVDLSCMRKASTMLEQNGFRGDTPFVVPSGRGKSVWKHLWVDDYNQPIMDFFLAEEAKAR